MFPVDIIHLGAENCVTGSCHQAKGTLGRRILEGKTKVNACVHVLSGYSAHADQAGLVNWVRSMPEPPGKIKLVHGEPLAQKALAKALFALGLFSIVDFNTL